ncbi:hypothetical protein AZF37_09550 [endosymbiont 'TC1' of Trimyema compressum]|nr:hypothetical protein AZF37_09550 [endosymbiont 'TC1' of Trimyema compressum]
MVDANDSNKQIASLNLAVLQEGANEITFKTTVDEEQSQSRLYTQVVDNEGKALDENIEVIDIVTFGDNGTTATVSTWIDFMTAVSSPTITKIVLNGNIIRDSGARTIPIPSKELTIEGNGNSITFTGSGDTANLKPLQSTTGKIAFSNIKLESAGTVFINDSSSN